MPLPALGELPQLTALSLAWRRLVDVKPVLMLVNNTGLVCCWEQRGRWQQRVVGWPEGVCRDGVPLQREAVGELIADLIFDCDCPGAELVLCLPLEAASWCVVDGFGADGSPGLLPQALQSVDLPFDLAESYVTSSPAQEALAVVGVPRSLIQAWSEVAELADLPLRRVDWLLTAAQRALDQLTQAWVVIWPGWWWRRKACVCSCSAMGFLRLTMHLMTSTLWPASARFGPVLLPGKPVSLRHQHWDGGCRCREHRLMTGCLWWMRWEGSAA